MKAKEIYTYILAGLILVGYFALIACIIIKVIPTDNREMANNLFSTLTVIVVLVIKFFFDGNKESASRDQMLYNSAPPTVPTSSQTQTETTTKTDSQVKDPANEVH